MDNKTSWGSFFAAVGGMAGSATPFLPPQYQWIGGLIAFVSGAVATKIP